MPQGVGRICDSGLQFVHLTLVLEVEQPKPRESSSFHQPAKCVHHLYVFPAPFQMRWQIQEHKTRDFSPQTS